MNNIELISTERGRLLFYRKDVEEVQKNLHELAGSDRLEAYREERRAFVKEMETVSNLFTVISAP
jgi:hypothetical protein